jgi:Domain of unknown function (DUF1902)
MASLHERKSFEIRAEWDGEAGVWWCSNDELPLTTEAPTFEQLVSRVLEIAPEIAAENGLAAPATRSRCTSSRNACNLCLWWPWRECPQRSVVSRAAS